MTGEHQLPRSPYPSTLDALVDAFCTSRERGVILRGLIEYRQLLRAEGFASGFQWIDGSFVENCEAVRGRPPADMDVVSLLRRPVATAAPADWMQFVGQRALTIFDPQWTKANYRCDSYYIDLDGAPDVIAELAAYWIGLFSHQRDTFRWKGLVQVDFGITDDATALALIEARELAW